MNNCASCKHGQDRRPGGEKAAPGTVWCGQRGLQMGSTRQMPCFTPRAGRKINHCGECKRAKTQIPSGGLPQLGNVWCEKRRFEINRQRSMECFE